MRRHDQWGRRIDRRRARRESLERDAYFGSGNIEELPQTGQALDVSRDGVLIRTSRPLPEGTAIEVEMRPERWQAGAQLILTRGRVARIVDRGNGDYDMGVRLHVSPGYRAPFARTRDAKHAITDVGSLLANLGPRAIAQTHAHRSRWGKALPSPVRFRESRGSAPTRSGWRSWIAPIALLATGLLLMLLWPWLLSDVKEDGGLKHYPARQASEPLYEEMLPPREVVSPSNSRSTPRNDLQEVRPVEPMPETAPPVMDLGWPEPAQSTLRDADYPAPKQDSARNMGESGDSFHGRSRKGAAALYRSVDGVVLDVDTQTHRMRLFVDGALRAAFRIGLGKDGSTPAGDFTIGNKLTNPDWYNKGDVVQAGDPKNPIGRRWMGLARDGALTTYGIHATEDFASLGTDRSRGCIRVLPKDANTLFRLCPVGARVVIR
jgi:hypothetical protein